MEMYLYVCVPVTAHQSGQENLQDEYQKQFLRLNRFNYFQTDRFALHF